MTSINFTGVGIGKSFTLNFNGQTGADVVPGLGAPAANPVLSGLTSSQMFNRGCSGVVASLGAREFCLRAGAGAGGGGSRCARGGSGGIGEAGDFSPDQQLSLTFASVPTIVSLAKYSIKYQMVKGVQGVSSAEGVGDYAPPLDQITTDAVPEPASWAMVIAGFALIGEVMRRRRLVVAA